jgi:hypothetical protein
MRLSDLPEGASLYKYETLRNGLILKYIGKVASNKRVLKLYNKSCLLSAIHKGKTITSNIDRNTEVLRYDDIKSLGSHIPYDYTNSYFIKG